MNNPTIPKNYLSVEQYALLSEVTQGAIYARISALKISCKIFYIDGYPCRFIDIKKYPTAKGKQSGRKKITNT